MFGALFFQVLRIDAGLEMKPSARWPMWSDGHVGCYCASVALPEIAAQTRHFLIKGEIGRQSVFSCLSSVFPAMTARLKVTRAAAYLHAAPPSGRSGNAAANCDVLNMKLGHLRLDERVGLIKEAAELAGRQANTHVKLKTICLHSRANQKHSRGFVEKAPDRGPRSVRGSEFRYSEGHAAFQGRSKHLNILFFFFFNGFHFFSCLFSGSWGHSAWMMSSVNKARGLNYSMMAPL